MGKRKKTTSPTQRSLAYLRDLGYTCAVVEKFVRFPPPGHRVDLFGFIDLLALGPGRTVAAQVTSGSNLSSRVKKIREHENYPLVRRSGWVIEVHGWRKLKDGRWYLRILDMESGCERNG